MNWPTVRAVAAFEFRLAWRHQTLLVLAVCLALLWSGSLLLCGDSFQKAAGLTQELQDLVERQWQEQPDRHPHRVAHYGTFAIRPPTALSLFDRGVESFTGRAVFLEAHVQNSANFAESRESNGLLRFGQLTPAFILQTLVPLLLIFFACSAVTRERERQTLPLLFLQSVRPTELLFGKVIGLGSALLGLALPLASGAGLITLAGMDHSLDQDELTRLLLLGMGYGLYLAGILTFSVLVSNRSRSTTQALLTLLTLWMVGVVFLPKLLPSLGETFFPSPSRPQFELALHREVVDGGHGHNPGDPHFEQQKKELLERYQVEKVEDLPVNFRGIAMKAGEEHSAVVYQKHYWQLQDVYKSQNRFSEWASLVNPYLAVRSFSAALAGTDYHHLADFERQSEQYRYRLIQQLNDLHIEKIAYQDDKEQRLDSSHWHQFEPFQYRLPSLSWSLENTAVAGFSLVLWFFLPVYLMTREEVPTS